MISVLITSLNRRELLRRSLARLGELTLPGQLVVINDGGDEDLAEPVAEFSRATGVPSICEYLDNPGRTTPSRARNAGLRHCAGDVILTTEPEVFFRSNVVALAPRLMAEHPSEVLTPGTVFYAAAAT